MNAKDFDLGNILDGIESNEKCQLAGKKNLFQNVVQYITTKEMMLM